MCHSFKELVREHFIHFANSLLFLIILGLREENKVFSLQAIRAYCVKQ